MELRRYLQVMARRWKLVAVVAVVAIVLTALLVSRDTAVYEASGTYVIRPRALEDDETVRATEALNRGVEINSTYARIARSDIVKARARQALQDQGISTSGLSVTSSVVPGTNILEIGARGGDPEIVAAYAAAIGEETAAYLNEIGEVFVLDPLDTPRAPRSAEPSRSRLTLALGAIFGLSAGAVLAFTLDYLSERRTPEGLNLRDEVTGAYCAGYFRMRLRQEMSRCEVPPDPRVREASSELGSRNFSLGLVTMRRGQPGGNGSDPPARPGDLRTAVRTLETRLREQDVLAYIGDSTFAVIFPDLGGEPAYELLAGWSAELGTTAGTGSAVRTTLSVCECDAGGLRGDEETMRIAYAV